MPTYKVESQGKARSVESELTTRQAADICINLHSGFARELANRFLTSQRLSEKQVSWLQVMAVESQNTRQVYQDRLKNAPVLKGVVGILQLITVAKEHGLKRIGIRIAQDVEHMLKLTVAGPNTRVPGSINVIDGKNSECWHGRIHTDGTLDLRPNTPEWVTQLLVEFANDPPGVATRYGRLTSCCSFCSLSLADERSVVVGYGPICAKHYGLPWGETKMTPTDFEKPETAREKNLRYAGLGKK